ncbi:MAG: Omp28-related outer membrane protein [Bacteroidales bacterium]|nr:Omp28-related outer membrane protein [Bacteroidales bacterium]
MKRFSITAMFLLLLTTALNAQNLVSTEPTNRNVIIEEFTGVYCQYCPEGHKVASEIAAAYPDNIFLVNIHAGNYATTSYPNFTTDDGNAIYSGFEVKGFPSGLVNRTTSSSVSRSDWGSYSKQQMGQAAECNVAGQVAIDKETRKATITVEVYYTSNSASETNYLNVVMLQDNIYARQNSGGVWNENYCHMHALRDVVTPTWGEAINSTTAGTLVAKTYTYDIPENIGGSNGFEVKLDDIEFLAFVTEQYQGSATRPILNANRLHTLFVTSDEIHPEIVSLGLSAGISCSNDKVINVAVSNSGVNELTSLKFEVSVDNGEPVTKTWEGSIAKYRTVNVELDVNIPQGTHDVNVKIVEANGVKFEDDETLTVKNEGWGVVKTTGEEAEITIELMQDKYGTQITWELLASDYSVLASGGPYKNLSGSSATELHEIKVKVPVNECVKFVIRDSKNNGICCFYGDGYYKILNSKGKVIVDGAGDFGAEASNIISIVEGNEEEADRLPAPTNVLAMSLNDTELVLMWDAVEGAASYNVYNEDKLVGTYEEVNTKITELTPGTEYCFTVTAVDKIGESEKSEKACATTSGEKPEEPENPGEGIEELKSSIILYPNPVNDKLYIETLTQTQTLTVEIYDIYGRIQNLSNLATQQHSNSIDVTNLNSGVYFVKVVTENGEAVRRFVKK